VLAHFADRIDRNFVRVLMAIGVRVELSGVDAGGAGLSGRCRDVSSNVLRI
jgi:hypothetical protein